MSSINNRDYVLGRYPVFGYLESEGKKRRNLRGGGGPGIYGRGLALVFYGGCEG